MKIGIIKEGKTPPDKRVPFTPQQCKQILSQFDNVEIVVQPSNIRAFPDEAYKESGIPLQENLSDCDVIMGVKEVNIEDLIPEKRFIFFSHTFKQQPYNRKLLQAILKRKIALTDYETMTDKKGKRLIGFGRYAGIVGCYNGFRTYGLKHQLFELKPAHECEDRAEVERELQKVKLPSNTKIVLTGKGRVGKGALEIIHQLPITEVSPEEYLSQSFDHPVYTSLDVEAYNNKNDGSPFDKRDFYHDPSDYHSTFDQYLSTSDLYIACHYWDARAPFIFTKEDLKRKDVRVSVVADISCDIDGPVASTIRPSTIADPIYGYDPYSEQEAPFNQEGVIAVMAVDNLPCELPKDASEDFGNELIKNIIPALLGDDPDHIIDRATETTFEGTLNSHYQYLEDYAKEEAL